MKESTHDNIREGADLVHPAPDYGELELALADLLFAVMLRTLPS